MKAFDYAERWGHEEIVMVRDAASGLRAIIALHDTTLGPAIGGTRMRPYPSEEEALLDALRLARAMTYKCAMAGMAYGGGKAVIVGDPARLKTPALLTVYARVVERLGGRFVATVQAFYAERAAKEGATGAKANAVTPDSPPDIAAFAARSKASPCAAAAAHPSPRDQRRNARSGTRHIGG